MHGVRPLLLICMVLLFVAPAASAQQDITTTELKIQSDPFQSEPAAGLARNDSSNGFVYVELCVTGPGLNPQSGYFTVTAAVTSAPDWVIIPPLTESYDFMPPAQNANQAESCGSQKEQFQLNPTIAATAPYNTTGTVTVTVTAVQEGDIGTYQDVSGDYTVDMSIKTVDAPEPTGTGGGGGGGGGSSDDDAPEESPGVGPLTLVVTLAALAVLRRRR